MRCFLPTSPNARAKMADIVNKVYLRTLIINLNRMVKTSVGKVRMMPDDLFTSSIL